LFIPKKERNHHLGHSKIANGKKQIISFYIYYDEAEQGNWQQGGPIASAIGVSKEEENRSDYLQFCINITTLPTDVTGGEKREREAQTEERKDDVVHTEAAPAERARWPNPKYNAAQWTMQGDRRSHGDATDTLTIIIYTR
jgi:hypothetical protein